MVFPSVTLGQMKHRLGSPKGKAGVGGATKLNHYSSLVFVLPQPCHPLNVFSCKTSTADPTAKFTSTVNTSKIVVFTMELVNTAGCGKTNAKFCLIPASWVNIVY